MITKTAALLIKLADAPTTPGNGWWEWAKLFARNTLGNDTYNWLRDARNGVVNSVRNIRNGVSNSVNGVANSLNGVGNTATTVLRDTGKNWANVYNTLSSHSGRAAVFDRMVLPVDNLLGTTFNSVNAAKERLRTGKVKQLLTTDQLKKLMQQKKDYYWAVDNTATKGIELEETKRFWRGLKNWVKGTPQMEAFKGADRAAILNERKNAFMNNFGVNSRALHDLSSKYVIPLAQRKELLAQ